MNYSIIYSSKTGNTARLAQHIAKKLPKEDCRYLGPPAEAPTNLPDLVFAGFWTDKGTCDSELQAFLKTLQGKQIFLFGTAGFGGGEAYFSQIFSRVVPNIDASNQIIGTYLCQGKMPLPVRQRYETMAAQEPQKMQAMIANFDRASSHPDAGDLAGLAAAVDNALTGL